MDASGQCVCIMELSDVTFPARKVEQMESDFYNLTNRLQEHLNQIYMNKNNVSTIMSNFTDLIKRVKYSKTFGTHVDLDFQKIISELHSVIKMAQNISKNAITNTTKDTINILIDQINDIQTIVATMETHDRNNIIAVQREIIALREKLQECEEAIASGNAVPNVTKSTPIGKCDHDGLLKVSDPVLVKLNWKGPDFKGGAWGKDFALGTKTPDHYWVFPLNKDERTLENYRLYSSYRKLLLYSPVREYSLNIDNNPKCSDCGQGAGVVFFNGSFYYNCFDSRALCKADPFSMRTTREKIEDQDPASFNNWFSYKGVKYQDIDLAGDEKGLWMVHGSTLSNGKLVIRKVDPHTLKVGTPWITSQSKDSLSNSFMICGVLYATKRKNSTHEEIHFMYDTNKGQERNIKIFMEKPLPTVQSLNYNPNDQKLYMFNDGYLVSYNLTFMPRLSKRIGNVAAAEHQALDAEGQKNLVKRELQATISSCDHDGLLSVSGPIVVKLNWKGANFKAGSWGKDFALGTKSPDHYWVFPADKDNYILEKFRLYSSYKKLMLYFPVLEFSLRGNNDKCENCGQGGGVVFFNGSFYYNCYNSRSLCKIDPHTMRLLRKELEDEDPPSFNDVFSYKGVKFQDMDMAGDEKGLWMIHGSKKADGNMVIRKVNPDTLQIGRPWIISQQKTNVSNTFMICGVLYATRRLNSTHEEIFYAFDTNSAQERKLHIFLEKPLPTLQSLNYNPNDQKLYVYNDGYLVQYDVTFKGRRASRSGEAIAPEHGLDVHYGKSQSLAIMPAKTATSKEELNLASQ
ncbi:hypothetical protein JD844_022321 [Phrynosoma platyrhinos]|uniref:Olfactomedin-like domain-containing protein n=1 Tax=Phrynosoma platyrhinos TaxID=52577 RepID=A0ABQ7SUY9_PHRPL|nr:hypothetical protein JD844_022321 [Phrynosoma platyrhinos]